ncbi:hypothetical protein QFC19_000074 [Naganishia cerealis]|uniref:Uncharacterized protein n=1 Tax=Naganishia cerealis TaxID=610337 RepID=A0ACC2WS07_9TREE|nr:hypothetical protein QFC19_000074 [Naganishia cerealis]
MLATASLKTHCRPPLSPSHAFKLVSPNVLPPRKNTASRATDVSDIGEDSRVVASSSSGTGSTFTAGPRYADMDDLDMMDDETEGRYSTIKGMDARGSSSTSHLSQTNGTFSVQARITGTALNGTAFITRLGLADSRTRTSRPEPELEEDLDWDQGVQQRDSHPLTGSNMQEKLKLRLANPHTDNLRVDSVDLDEIDLDEDSDDDGEQARQSTLKAGTITYHAVAAQARSQQQVRDSLLQTGKTKIDMEEEDNMEDGFQLPLTLKHLKLVSRSPQPSAPAAGIRHRRRSSRSSLASAATSSRSASDWDNIGTPGNARTRAHDDGGDLSETSSRASSVVVPGTVQSETDQDPMNRAEQEVETEDDLEQGIELPTPSFFSGGRARELNRLLDKKRKPQLSRSSSSNEGPAATYRASTPTLMKPTLSSAAKYKFVTHAQDRIEDYLEDGLVLEDERTELTHGRLARIRQTRATNTGGTPTGPRNAAGGTLKRGFILGRQRVDSSSRRPTTDQMVATSLLPSRSVSSSGSGLLATQSHTRTSRALASSPPPAPASTAGISSSDVASATPRRLRHQASHSRLGLPPPPSPSLGKRQSMSSIREMAHLHETTGYSTYHLPVPDGLSYTAQTAASVDKPARGRMENESTGSDEWPTTSRSRTSSDHSATVRSTPSTGANRTVKARAPLSSAFAPDKRTDHAATAASSTRFLDVSIAHHHQLVKPKPGVPYGDGTELDAFEDLQLDRAKEGMIKVPKGSSGVASCASLGRCAAEHLGLVKALIVFVVCPTEASPVKALDSNVTAEKRKKHPSTPVPAPRQAATSKGKPIVRKAGLIRHLGRVEKKKVGDMTWNPETLRWEGNYQVLRDFDAQVMTSARPALITHYAAFSSMNTLSSQSALSGDKARSTTSTTGKSSTASSSTLNAVRVVGNMMFDPERMCWISTLPAEEDEADPFANIEEEDFSDKMMARSGSSGADDQDSDSAEDTAFLRGGTITKDTGKAMMEGIRSRAAGAMRFSSATTTSSITSAATSVASHTSRSDRRQADFRLGKLVYEEGDEDWKADIGIGAINPRLQRASVSKPGRSASSRSSGQTDSGFKVKALTSSSSFTDSPHPKYSRDHFRPTRHVSQQLWEQSTAAEARHEREMCGWRVCEQTRAALTTRDCEKEREREKRREEKRLWEIRNLAMRS